MGAIVMLTTGGGSLTATTALADFLGSACLVTVTRSLVATVGAVYRPVELTVPTQPGQDQLTAVLVVPVTVATNC